MAKGLGSFGSILRNTASALAVAATGVGIPLPAKGKAVNLRASHEAGKKHTPHRKGIKYERKGPFYEQTGSRAGRLLMRVVYRHRILHATKGWREYSTGTPFLRLPNLGRARRYGPINTPGVGGWRGLGLGWARGTFTPFGTKLAG